MSTAGEFEGRFREGFDHALEDHQQVILDDEFDDDADDRIVQVEPITQQALDRAVGKFLELAGEHCRSLGQEVSAQALGGCLYHEWAGFGLRYSDLVVGGDPGDALALANAARKTSIDGFLAAFVRDEDGSISMEPISLSRLEEVVKR